MSDSTALRSRTAGRCAGRCAGPGSPLSEQERGSARTAASASSTQEGPFSWLELCELEGAETMMHYRILIPNSEHLVFCII